VASNIFFNEPIRPIGKPVEQTKTVRTEKTGGTSFDAVLAEKMAQIKFSAHAQQRLKSRNIELGQAELERLQEAVNKARSKGARESLVLMDNLALVVSVKNNTVITAVDGDSIKENVFTNIDSAVVI